MSGEDDIPEYSIPGGILQKITCSLCQKYLSVPPIFYNTESKHKCGRCSFINFGTCARATLYESLASLMKFPCPYAECNLQVPWAEVLHHETVCEVREITCPFTNCSAKVGLNKLIEHCEKAHHELIYVNCFKRRDTLESTGLSMSLLISNSGKPYILFDYLSNATCSFSVYSFPGDDSKNAFSVRVTSLSSFITVNGQEVKSFDDKEHCGHCLLKKCRNKFHKNSLSYGENNLAESMTTIIKKKSLVDILGSSNISYAISIQEICGDRVKENYSVKNSYVLRQVLECQICNDLMTAPIFSCETGHSLCQSCKSKLIRCPSCQVTFSDNVTRNFCLEEVAESADLPCHNEQIGCDFTGNVHELYLHEKNCVFSVI